MLKISKKKGCVIDDWKIGVLCSSLLIGTGLATICKDGLKRPKGESLAEIKARDAARKKEFAEKLKNRPSIRGDAHPSSAQQEEDVCAALKRPKGETLAELRARDAERKREFAEKLKTRQPISTCPQTYAADEERPDTPGRKRPRETLVELKKREAERKRELAEKLKNRPSVQAAASGSAEQCKRPLSGHRGETLAELQARDRERKKELQALKKVKSKLGTIDYKPREAKPRGDTLAELKRKNLEMKRRLKEKVASRTPPHLRVKKKESVTPRPATTGARPRTAMSQTAQCVRPKTTTGPGSRPRTGTSPSKKFETSVSRAEQDEIIRLRAEIDDLRQMLAEVKQQEACIMPPGEAPPRPTYMAKQRELTDPTFEGTRYLLETAYKSFGKVEAMCPNFLNDDVKRAAKVLIGLAAGFVPGTPYHSLYKRALKEGRSEPVDSQSMLPEQIVLRPGDVDPNATTIVKVTGSGDVDDVCGPSEERSVKVVQARPSPYSTQQNNSLAGIQESVDLPPLPEEDEDEMTTELREILENLRPPDRGTQELRDVVGTIRAPKWEDNREYGLGRPISPLRDFETEEDNLLCIKPTTPEVERKRRRHKQAMRERDLEQLERQKKASLARIRRELWAKAGAVAPGMEDYIEEDEAGRVRVENLIRPVTPVDDNLIDFGPYGEELVQNVAPRSRYARQLGLEGEGQGVDLCLGDRY